MDPFSLLPTLSALLPYPNWPRITPLLEPKLEYKKNQKQAMFKAPQHPQLRVGRRPCKGPRVDTKIVKKI